MTETKMKDSPQDKEIKRSELNEDVPITSEEVKEEFSFMETVIKAIEKLVIKDVIDWANKKIEEQKKGDGIEWDY